MIFILRIVKLKGNKIMFFSKSTLCAVLSGLVFSTLTLNAAGKAQNTMPTYDLTVTVPCASEAEAANARLDFLELPPGKSVAFSCRWDDNNIANLRMKKLMQKYGYKGTFYLLKIKPHFQENVFPELYKDGFTIGNHTLNHPSLSLLTPNGIFYEMLEMRMILETLSGQTVNAFIFPNGNASNLFYTDAAQVIASCLRRTGMLGGPDNATAMLNKMPGNEFFSPEGRIIYPGDRNTSAEKFDAHVKRSLPAAGKTAHMTLGIHVWHSDKDFAELEKAMKKHSARPDWWYCNENEFLSYTYMYRYAKVTGKKVVGKNAVFTVKMPRPEYLGSEVALWAKCANKNIELKHTRSTPVKIVTAAKDGKVAEFPGVTAKIFFTAPDRIRLEVVNNSAALEDVGLILRLPPDFAEETLYVYAGRIAGKYQQEWQLTPKTAWQSSGMQIAAAQLDFKRNGESARIWVKHCREIKSTVKPAAEVFCSKNKITVPELEKLSMPDAKIDPAHFYPTGHQCNFRETMFMVNPRAVSKETQTVVMEFEGGKPMLLQGDLPKVVYCNGKQLKVTKRTLKFDAPAGKCRIVFQHLNQRRPLRNIQLILTAAK